MEPEEVSPSFFNPENIQLFKESMWWNKHKIEEYLQPFENDTLLDRMITAINLSIVTHQVFRNGKIVCRFGYNYYDDLKLTAGTVNNNKVIEEDTVYVPLNLTSNFYFKDRIFQILPSDAVQQTEFDKGMFIFKAPKYQPGKANKYQKEIKVQLKDLSRDSIFSFYLNEPFNYEVLPRPGS